MNLSQLQTFFLGVIAVCSVVGLMLRSVSFGSVARRARANIPSVPTSCWRCFEDRKLLSAEEALARTLPIGVCRACADELAELSDMRDARRDKPRPPEPLPPCVDCGHEGAEHRTAPGRCLARRHDIEALAGAGVVMICDCKGYATASGLKAL